MVVSSLVLKLQSVLERILKLLTTSCEGLLHKIHLQHHEKLMKNSMLPINRQEVMT